MIKRKVLDNRGLTLVEVVIALVFVTIVSAGLITGILVAAKINQNSAEVLKLDNELNAEVLLQENDITKVSGDVQIILDSGKSIRIDGNYYYSERNGRSKVLFKEVNE